ncbi:hypothetical protein [Burkholderia sp. BCC1977]|uniref:hypothetical protein n=1 Tax=Burkholderia sp. BCC1977 TaxID=2817440 RepID=UPI002ABE5D2A|nr:hypothetical protein [Burkholderia sp. BCC1977]
MSEFANRQPQYFALDRDAALSQALPVKRGLAEDANPGHPFLAFTPLRIPHFPEASPNLITSAIDIPRSCFLSFCNNP